MTHANVGLNQHSFTYSCADFSNCCAKYIVVYLAMNKFHIRVPYISVNTEKYSISIVNWIAMTTASRPLDAMTTAISMLNLLLNGE